MTDQDLTPDGEVVLTLQQLIRDRMDANGWTYADLARRSLGDLTAARWQQLGTSYRTKSWPEPRSIRVMAEALEVDETAIVLAAAQSLGIDARRRGPDLAQLLPAGTDRLSPKLRDAILAVVRAAVAETLVADGDDDAAGGTPVRATVRWSEASSAQRGNEARGGGD